MRSTLSMAPWAPALSGRPTAVLSQVPPGQGLQIPANPMDWSTADLHDWASSVVQSPGPEMITACAVTAGVPEPFFETLGPKYQFPDEGTSAEFTEEEAGYILDLQECFGEFVAPWDSFDAMEDPTHWGDTHIPGWLTKYQASLESNPQCRVSDSVINALEEWEQFQRDNVTLAVVTPLDDVHEGSIAAIKAWQECLKQDLTTKDRTAIKFPLYPVLIVGGGLALVVALVG